MRVSKPETLSRRRPALPGFRSLRVALSKAWRVPALLGLVALGTGCVAVRPEQRAILADRIMQFGADARARAALDHVLDNREGSFGSGAVQGGGCGCN